MTDQYQTWYGRKANSTVKPGVASRAVGNLTFEENVPLGWSTRSAARSWLNVLMFAGGLVIALAGLAIFSLMIAP